MWPFNTPYKHRLVSERRAFDWDAGMVPYLRLALDLNFAHASRHTPEFLRTKAHQMVDDMLDKATTEELAHPS